MFRILALTVLSCLFFSACRPEADTEDVLVATGAWKLSKREYQIAGQTTWDNQPIPACEADDTYTFNENGSFEYSQGALKCSPGSASTETGTWKVTNGGNTLSFPIDGVAIDFMVQEATEGRVVLVGEFVGDKVRNTLVPR